MGSGKPLQKGVFVGGLFAGLGLGALFFGLFAGLFGYVRVKAATTFVRRGWALTPVLVAAQDLPPGQAVTAQMISQRNVPEQFVTASVIKPDSASYILNQRLSVPVRAGDLLNWTYFASSRPTKGGRMTDPPVVEECQRALQQRPDAPRADPTVEAIRARLLGAGR